MTLDLETGVMAIRAHACEPAPCGRTAWRARCPSCDEPDALGLTDALIFGLGVLPSCRCSRRDVLAALGLEDGER